MRAKKALGAYDMIYWIARILFAVLMLVTLYAVASIYESKVLDTAETEAKLFKHYLLYSPNGLSYTDPYTGRLYPGVLSLDNFNTERLESAASFGKVNNMVAAKVQLLGDCEYDEFTLSAKCNRNITDEVYYNEQKYRSWIPLIIWDLSATSSTQDFRFKGIAGTVWYESSRLYVTYIDSNNYQRSGVLLIEVLVPKI